MAAGRAARLGWHEIHKATWSGRELTVTPAEVVEERDGYAVIADAPPVRTCCSTRTTCRTRCAPRVTSSVAYTAHHPLPGGGVRVAARRVPGVDGLTWTVRYDPGTRVDDRPVVAETDELVGRPAASALAGRREPTIAVGRITGCESCRTRCS